MNQKRGKTAVTLVETIVVVFITILVSAMMINAFYTKRTFFEIGAIRSNIQAEARKALRIMSYELREATRVSTQTPSPNIIIPAQPNNTTISFYLPNDNDGDGAITSASSGDIEWGTGNIIQYIYSGANRQLQRIEGGNTTILANNVESVLFNDIVIDNSLSIFEVRINLIVSQTTTAQENITFLSSAIIRLRN